MSVDWKQVKKHAKRAWHFIWHEESAASWAVNIIVAFILIKYLVYPGLGLLLGTGFPVVAVVSGSMEHHPGNFEQWWALNEDFYLGQNITQFDFMNYPFRNGFNKGDIMVLAGADPDTLRLGEVIVYWSGKSYPIIHRYIGTNTESFSGTVYLVSKGDNNPNFVIAPDLDEKHIPQELLLGKAVFRIPLLGYVKIWAVDAFRLLLGLF